MWDEVIKKTAILKSLDNNCVLTYSEYHRYEFNPPVSLEKVVEIEKTLGVVFPIELRTFYLEVGNGGAGPHTGLHRIEDLEPYRPHEDWPGIDYIDMADDDGNQEMDSRVSGAIAIMDRFYHYENLIVMNGEDAGQIIAFEPWGFIFRESDSLIDLYNEWLDQKIGHFDWIRGLIESGDPTQEIVQEMYDSKRNVVPENALPHIASLVNFPFPYYPDALNARSYDRSVEGMERVVIDDETLRMFDDRLANYRSEQATNFLSPVWKFFKCRTIK